MSLRRDEFARRRRQLMRMMGKGAIAILPTAMEKQRNSDVHYFFRPDHDDGRGYPKLPGFGCGSMSSGRVGFR